MTFFGDGRVLRTADENRPAASRPAAKHVNLCFIMMNGTSIKRSRLGHL